MSTRSRTILGAGFAATVAGVLLVVVLGAPVTAKPGPPPPSDDTTTTTTQPDATTTSTTTTTTTTTTTLPLTKVLAETIVNDFPDTPSSPGAPTIEVPPPTDEPAPTTRTAAPVESTTTTTTTTIVPNQFERTHDRIVVSGVVREAPPTVVGDAGTFARAYGTTGGLSGIASVQGTEALDPATDTFAQVAGRTGFVGTLRGVGHVALTFVTTIPRSTSFAGDELATESGQVTGMKGWDGAITLRYRVTHSGNSKGTYRAVFTRHNR